MKKRVDIEPTRFCVNGESEAIGYFPCMPATRRSDFCSSAVVEVPGSSQQDLQRFVSRRHGQRISGQCSGLIHRPARRHHRHDLPSSAVRADRQSAADDLSERRQIGINAVQFLRAPGREPESGHDFVKDQHDPFVRAELPQPFEESRLRRDASHVPDDRLDDDRGDRVPDVRLRRAFSPSRDR